MAQHIAFPVRITALPVRSHDSLARDTQYQALRIAEQVEREMARQASRMATGLRPVRPAGAPRTVRPVLMMPSPATAVKSGRLAAAGRRLRGLFGGQTPCTPCT